MHGALAYDEIKRYTLLLSVSKGDPSGSDWTIWSVRRLVIGLLDIYIGHPSSGRSETPSSSTLGNGWVLAAAGKTAGVAVKLHRDAAERDVHWNPSFR